ncbi:MAG TPA: CGNR zinc finger domain-containing protein [candidate division Zixibacteria bacterium]|nr:CGNR zinc finger domain-containing protein [candidate division Zixibacteria bacterium]
MTSETYAGPDLELVMDFVNTNDVEDGRDVIATPRAFAAWLADRGVAPAGVKVSPDLHRRALDVREGIRALGRANNDEPLEADRVEAMNRAARRLRLSVQLRHDRWSLEPSGDPAEAFLAGVMATLARAMADDRWSRVKACRNDTCRWLYFDQSRNRSRTWCTMAICGSRLKARAYRARRRQAATA